MLMMSYSASLTPYVGLITCPISQVMKYPIDVKGVERKRSDPGEKDSLKETDLAEKAYHIICCINKFRSS